MDHVTDGVLVCLHELGDHLLAEYADGEPLTAVPAHLVDLALAALRRVTGANSEVLELWTDVGLENEFLAEIDRVAGLLQQHRV
ncbi:hypothetical protein [Catellatospora sichuanensis]|uniref:hypothetical protein n=1 Tax=Catellatospora sichuanensis TaxID=1969805 RepID=UPI001642F023|nr:hypothetical protein [Catellatospora sichuanensis]